MIVQMVGGPANGVVRRVVTEDSLPFVILVHKSDKDDLNYGPAGSYSVHSVYVRAGSESNYFIWQVSFKVPNCREVLAC